VPVPSSCNTKRVPAALQRLVKSSGVVFAAEVTIIVPLGGIVEVSFTYMQHGQVQFPGGIVVLKSS